MAWAERKHDGVTIFGDSVIDRILNARGVTSPDELNYLPANILPPDNMKDCLAAAQLLAEHRDKRIVIAADYDVDGATAAVIVYFGLKAIGARDVCVLVPDRAKEGYGLSPAFAERILCFMPDLVITVDNGIVNFDGAQIIKSKAKLIITDHHLPSADGRLPMADAIVNPNQPDCEFPSKNLAGCGVALYVIASLRRFGFRVPVPGIFQLAALGTVCDMVPLDRNNRIIVAAGLRAMNHPSLRLPGIDALATVAGHQGPFTTDTCGFVLGPRLNAAGRLADMTIGIQCLASLTTGCALAFAQKLHHINAERKNMQQQMTDTAKALVADLPTNSAAALCRAEWHEGIVGLVASEMKRELNAPVVCFAPSAGDPNILKGSMRSTETVHAKHLLAKIAAHHDDLMLGFGGHAMAAGLSIRAENLDRFSHLFTELANQELRQNGRDVIWHDGPIEGRCCSREWLMSLLEINNVWGNSFEYPLFWAKLQPNGIRELSGGKHLKLDCAIDGQTVVAVAFNVDHKLPVLRDSLACFEALVRPDLNYWNGRCELQLVIEHARHCEEHKQQMSA